MHRSYIVSTLGIVGFLFIALASANAEVQSYFFVAIFASVCTGFSVGLGEATFLGFMKGFPSKLVGDVSSGTGAAGVSGTLILLILKGMGLSNAAIYLVTIPTIAIYQMCYLWLVK